MKLSFIPGNLHLSESLTGYVLTVGGTEVFRTSSERAAVTRFNRLRTDMEKKGIGPAAVAKAAEVPQAAPKDLPVNTGCQQPRKRKVQRTSAPSMVSSFQTASSQRRKFAPRIKNHELAAGASANTTSFFREHMGMQTFLAGLRAERKRIDQAIAVLEQLQT